MIFADKLIKLRKKQGWSQEELAERMNVSRQSVSKWESAASLPDIDKLILLSKLFSVSLDYLLKDEITDEDAARSSAPEVQEIQHVRVISIDQAEEYLNTQSKSAVKTAIGTFLSVISVIPLLILGGACESGLYGISDKFASGLGIAVLLLLVAVAVGLFAVSGSESSKFEFLDHEDYELKSDAKEYVLNTSDKHREKINVLNTIGCILCVLSPVPIFIIMPDESDFYGAVAVSVMLFIIALAVILFVIAGTKRSSLKKLLQEGEYSKENRAKNEKDAIFGVYWFIVTAAYLTWSFISKDWSISWIIWPIAAVIYACIKKLYKKDE